VNWKEQKIIRNRRSLDEAMRQKGKYRVLHELVDLHHSLVLMGISNLKLLRVLSHLRPEIGTSQIN
jgi:phosphoribosyl-ATP pyrophosphohydrolase